MTETNEENSLVRVRAQVMCRDETTGGWVPMGGGGLSNVMVRRKPRLIVNQLINDHQINNQTASERRDDRNSSSSADSKPSDPGTPNTPKFGITSRSPVLSHSPLSANASSSYSFPIEMNVTIHSKNNSLQRSAFKKSHINGTHINGGSDDGKTNHKQYQAQEPKFDYLIFGKRISDQSEILSCTIEKDFQYNKVMPTFHHWITDEKRFGLTFQTAADARAFDKGVRAAIEGMLHDMGISIVKCRVFKTINPHEAEEEDKIFECLNLPTKSGSSSENSTSSHYHTSRRSLYDEYKPIFNTSASMASMHGPSKSHFNEGYKDVMLKQKLDESFAEDASKISSVIENALDADNYSYVQLAAVHGYMRPHGVEGRSARQQPGHETIATTRLSGKGLLERHESISSLKKHNLDLIYHSSESASVLNTFQSRGSSPSTSYAKKIQQTRDTFELKKRCRHCYKWYTESENKRGSCKQVKDKFKTCIHYSSMMKCAEGFMYHCNADSEGDYDENVCSCTNKDGGWFKRWLGLTCLSTVLPCLCCYPILNSVHWCCVGIGLAGGKHAPMN